MVMGEPSVLDTARGLVEFVQEGSGAPVLCIHGGGPSAMYFALRHPSRCRGSILCSTVASTPPSSPTGHRFGRR